MIRQMYGSECGLIWKSGFKSPITFGSDWIVWQRFALSEHSLVIYSSYYYYYYYYCYSATGHFRQAVHITSSLPTHCIRASMTTCSTHLNLFTYLQSTSDVITRLLK